MMKTPRILVSLMWSKIKITLNLAAENIALRQQLAVMKRTNKRPKIRMTDRISWVLLSRIWHPWRKSLVIVKPDTVVRWHRKGFKLFWAFKSKGPGRPRIGREIRDLVRKMAKANPGWGAPRIHGELLRLGFEVSERTVSNLMPRRPPNSKPSQTWRTFPRLKCVLSSYFEYYHNDRTHLSLGKDTPGGRPVQHRPVDKCKIIDLPRIGGLHHRYEWKKAA